LSIHVIGSSDIVIGFQLIGIKGIITEDPDEAKQKIIDISKSAKLSFIIIENKIAEKIEDFLDDFTLKNLNVLITTIPGIGETLPDLDSSSLLKKIIR